MEKRLAALEAVIPTLATKADVEKSSSDTIKWMVGTMAAGLGVFIVIMTFVLNNAIPKQSVTPTQQAPIVIQVPAPAAVVAQPAVPAPTKP